MFWPRHNAKGKGERSSLSSSMEDDPLTSIVQNPLTTNPKLTANIASIAKGSTIGGPTASDSGAVPTNNNNNNNPTRNPKSHPPTLRKVDSGASDDTLPFLADIRKKKNVLINKGKDTEKKEDKRWKKLIEDSNSSVLHQRFTKDEVKWLWKDWLIKYPSMSDSKNKETLTSKGITIEEWHRSLPPPTLTTVHPMLKEVFRVSDYRNDGIIDFEEYTTILSIAGRGTLEEKLEVLFKLLDSDRDNLVKSSDIEEIINISKALFALAKGKFSKEIIDSLDSKDVSDQLFISTDKVGPNENTLNLKEFKRRGLSQVGLILTIDGIFDFFFDHVLNSLEAEVLDYKHQVFGRDLYYVLKHEQSEHEPEKKIPDLVKKVFAFYLNHPIAIRTEGIFRLSGNVSVLQVLKSRINEGFLDDIDFETVNIHIIGDLFKTFLRELPEPLVCFPLFDEFIQLALELEGPTALHRRPSGLVNVTTSTDSFATPSSSPGQAIITQGTATSITASSVSLDVLTDDVKTETGPTSEAVPKMAKRRSIIAEPLDDKISSSANNTTTTGEKQETTKLTDEKIIERLKYLTSCLPPTNLRILKEIVFFLGKVSEVPQNKMDVSNIATIFGPLVLSRKPSEANQTNTARIIQESRLIISIVELFIKLRMFIFDSPNSVYDMLIVENDSLLYDEGTSTNPTTDNDETTYTELIQESRILMTTTIDRFAKQLDRAYKQITVLNNQVLVLTEKLSESKTNITRNQETIRQLKDQISLSNNALNTEIQSHTKDSSAMADVQKNFEVYKLIITSMDAYLQNSGNSGGVSALLEEFEKERSLRKRAEADLAQLRTVVENKEREAKEVKDREIREAKEAKEKELKEAEAKKYKRKRFKGRRDY
eukprot:TRINITY_DN317_c2_g1_i2.p1 TRINITY_DN317_c2_g1~~TRINITY_DN317_c2_g1_i2.p1  ORF type:complete len:879 (-),score=194.68 TRINITY_DN317_c2_g1_i2:1582-4218(-)